MSFDIEWLKRLFSPSSPPSLTSQVREKPLINIYCHSACKGASGAWAAFVAIPRSSISSEHSGVDNNVSSNRLQLIAAIQALSSLRFECKATVSFSSRYLYYATSQRLRGTSDLDLWKEYDRLCTIHSVETAIMAEDSLEYKMCQTLIESKLFFDTPGG